MLTTLMRVLAQRETGVLFAERADDSTAGGDGARKELYFVAGKLHHVASSNASELLGEYLVRRGKLEREELDLALAVLPRYGGRMGDTLISMGLVGPVDIFRAIREQGRDRVADLFLWRSGDGHVLSRADGAARRVPARPRPADADARGPRGGQARRLADGRASPSSR